MGLPVRDDGAARRKLRVLVVDDDGDSRDLFGEIVELAGHSATTVPNGAEALSAVHRGAFDVVLLDLTMPHVVGVEVARRVRETLGREAPRLVAVSGHSLTAQDRGRLPFDAYLVKPATPDVLIETIESVARGA